MSDFSLTLHPASEGDALVLSWDGHHAVIDLGRTADYHAARPWLVAASGIELFVISHIDADHIEGAMPMVAEATAPFQPRDVWFNGYGQLVAAKTRIAALEALSVDQGEKLTAGIRRFGWPWNLAYGGGPVSVDSQLIGTPVDLAGGLRLTLLSPSDKELAKLGTVWAAEIAAASLGTGQPDAAPVAPMGYETLAVMDVEALAATPFGADSTAPNGSCIAFLAEFGGKSVLLGADAFPGRIAQSLMALGYGPQNKLRLDLFKLCHHGSKANLSPTLLQMLDCTRFAISTDGTRHHHPNPETMARILINDPGRRKTFYFNTRQPSAEIWDAAALRDRWQYDCVFPGAGADGLEVVI